MTTPDDIKKLTDCYFFLSGQNGCTKGDACQFRHNEETKNVEGTCKYWLQDRCTDPNCRFRHPDKPLPKASRGEVRPCTFFANNRCTKGDQCPFSHDIVQSIPKPAVQPQFIFEQNNEVAHVDPSVSVFDPVKPVTTSTPTEPTPAVKKTAPKKTVKKEPTKTIKKIEKIEEPKDVVIPPSPQAKVTIVFDVDEKPEPVQKETNTTTKPKKRKINRSALKDMDNNTENVTSPTSPPAVTALPKAEVVSPKPIEAKVSQVKVIPKTQKSPAKTAVAKKTTPVKKPVAQGTSKPKAKRPLEQPETSVAKKIKLDSSVTLTAEEVQRQVDAELRALDLELGIITE